MNPKLLFLCPLLTNKIVKVKRIFLIAVALATLAFSCKKHDGFVIKGKITNAEGKYIYLEELKDKAQDENCSDKRIVDFYGKWEDFKLAYNYKNESFDKTVIIDFKDCNK